MKIINTLLVLSLFVAVQSQKRCITPNGERAFCRPVHECPIFAEAYLNLTPEKRTFILQSECKFRRTPYICCGSVVGFKNTNPFLNPGSEIKNTDFINTNPFLTHLTSNALSTTPPNRPIDWNNLPSNSIKTPPDGWNNFPSNPINNQQDPSSNGGATFPENPNQENNNQPSTNRPAIEVTASTMHRNINLLPSRKICGQQALTDKIFGGNETDLDEFPWMALLEYEKNGRSAGFSCGGMLINNRYVLTAAHCIVGEIVQAVGNLIRVRLGEHNTETNIDCVWLGNGEDRVQECNEPPLDLNVEDVIVHSGYNDASRDRQNDIALIRLQNAVQYTDFIKPLCLPLNNESTRPGSNLTIAGWGRTETANASPVKLQARIPYIDDQECRNIFTQASIRLADSQFCAGALNGIDSCDGDSGGPIMNFFPGDVTWYGEGLVSFGNRRCGTQGIPGVYTKISSFINWILDNIKP